mmetsp:Transcript_106888/g.341340  ORF Transcript_106888/g.341340 Transcript_106888/m.341340 type:complete len:80 (+) Transcript_106888:480-719(+)
MLKHKQGETKCRGVMERKDVIKYLLKGMELPGDFTCQRGYICEKSIPKRVGRRRLEFPKTCRHKVCRASCWDFAIIYCA